MAANDLADTDGRWSLYGSSDPTIIAGGHSHVFSMLMALTANLVPSETRAAVAYPADPAAAAPTDPAYWDFFVRGCAGRSAAIVWNGNQHQAPFLISAGRRFRVFDEQTDYPDGDGDLWVPEELLRQYWKPTFDDLSDVLGRLGDAAHVCVLGTPPPKAPAAVRRALSTEPVFVECAQELGLPIDEVPLMHDALRIALWRIMQRILEERAREAGATFVPVPASTVDAQGFLLESLSNPDATHANGAFGAILWRETLSAL